eukprot:c26544_g1_i2 orf=1209-2966(+)
MITKMSVNRRVTRSLSNELQARAAAQEAHGQVTLLQPKCEQGEISGSESAVFCRSTSEDMLIRSLVEGSMGMTVPSMEGIGFMSLAPTVGGDGEELCHNWIPSVENQGMGQHHTPCRIRQSSRRLSNELTALLQQNGQIFGQADSVENLLQSGFLSSDDVSGDGYQLRPRNFAPRNGEQAVDTLSLKTLSWLQQSQPLTRSRSSELRRRYAAMQGLPFPPTDGLQRQATLDTHELKPEVDSLKIFAISLANGRAIHPTTLSHIPQSSTSSFNLSHPGTGDSVSTVVSMLKGTLERKKLGNSRQWQQQHIAKDSCLLQQKLEEEAHTRLIIPPFHSVSRVDTPGQLNIGQIHNEVYGQLQTASERLYEGQTEVSFTGSGQIQPGLLSQAPSPSDSSGGAPVLSIGDDQCNSGQTNPNRDNTLKRAVLSTVDVEQHPKRQNSLGNYPSPSSFGVGNLDAQLENFQKSDLSKKPLFALMGSVSSSGGPVEKEDPSKKRRVERQRKMAEAKGRNSVPMMPSDLQASLKRCENLEKEVRSLKLNLSFMNRKDSEQTKQIEELQKQNEELNEERERLLYEVERLTSGTGSG